MDYDETAEAIVKELQSKYPQQVSDAIRDSLLSPVKNSLIKEYYSLKLKESGNYDSQESKLKVSSNVCTAYDQVIKDAVNQGIAEQNMVKYIIENVEAHRNDPIL